MFNFPSNDGYSPDPRQETEVERLRRELGEANEEIRRLRNALGSNHPLTVRGGMGGLF